MAAPDSISSNSSVYCHRDVVHGLLRIATEISASLIISNVCPPIPFAFLIGRRSKSNGDIEITSSVKYDYALADMYAFITIIFDDQHYLVFYFISIQ